MTPLGTRLSLTALTLLAAGCAQLHHAQLGDIDSRSLGGAVTPVDVKVSETGISTRDGESIARIFAHNAAQRSAVGDLSVVLELFQMGPRTGNPVFDATYAESVYDLVKDQCPSGWISDVESVRETRRYPVVSGEIVHISALCHADSGKKEARL